MATRFRLARVLRLRTQLREQAQDALAHARSELAALHERAAAARAAQAEVRAREVAAAAAGMTGDAIGRHRDWERALRAREQAAMAAAVDAAAEVERRRTVLLARRQEERQLEILRERARERAEVEDERQTMVLLDDLALRRRSERR
jgi:flagellar export protein FliJ